MEYVDVYVNRRPVAHALMQDDCLEPWMTPRRSRAPRARDRQRCRHVRLAGAFAHRRSRDEHWPIVYCEDCLTILAGRDPLARSLQLPRWKFDERNVIAARWAREWPKRGRPRADRPAGSVAWPDAA